MQILNYKTFLLFFSLIYLSSCEEEYDLAVIEAAPILVVDGQITTAFQKHQIKLSQSAGYNPEDGFPPVSDALVQISDGSTVFPLSNVGPGLYETDSIQGVPGNIYTLTIDWKGQQYTGRDTMPTIPSTFEAVDFSQEEQHRTFEYRRHQFGFPEANKWELIIAIRDSTDIPNFDISILGQQIGVEVIGAGDYVFSYFTHPNIEVNGLMNFEEAHFYGYRNPRIVTQKRYSLSDAYYQFLRAVFMETEWRGTLFDSTPANVTGNINNGALGFFSACGLREIQFEI